MRDCTCMTELSYARYLSDLFRASGEKCIVVDGDLIFRTQEVTNALCEALGIETGCISDQWAPVPLGERPTNPLIAHSTPSFLELSVIVGAVEKVSALCNLPESCSRRVQ